MAESVVTLKDVLPHEFLKGEYTDTPAYALRNTEVVAVHRDEPWPGPQKHVSKWIELTSGHVVGWNESPSRGWSFPVLRKRTQ